MFWPLSAESAVREGGAANPPIHQVKPASFGRTEVVAGHYLGVRKLKRHACAEEFCFKISKSPKEDPAPIFLSTTLSLICAAWVC